MVRQVREARLVNHEILCLIPLKRPRGLQSASSKVMLVKHFRGLVCLSCHRFKAFISSHLTKLSILSVSAHLTSKPAQSPPQQS